MQSKLLSWGYLETGFSANIFVKYRDDYESVSFMHACTHLLGYDLDLPVVLGKPFVDFTLYVLRAKTIF